MTDINSFDIDEVRTLKDPEPEDAIFLQIHSPGDITIVYHRYEFLRLIEELRDFPAWVRAHPAIANAGFRPSWFLGMDSSDRMIIELSNPKGRIYVRFRLCLSDVQALAEKLMREYQAQSS